MFKLHFCIFLIIHILGDFYLQSDKLAENKINCYKCVVQHSVIYIFVAIVCVIPIWSKQILILAVVLSILHFAFDSLKYLYIKKIRVQDATVYVVDQLIHLCCIAIASSIITYTNYKVKLLPNVDNYLSSITNNMPLALAWIGAMLMALKPANITIKQLLSSYKPREDYSDNPNNAGAFIGTLERIIILLLLSVGQYSAIGLVLTAKSVARYNKIVESKEFAEYYLLGTLLSTLYAIFTYFIFI